MLFRNIILIFLGSVLWGIVQAKTAFIGGKEIQLSIRDFEKVGDGLITQVDVADDHGQIINFNVRATVSGQGNLLETDDALCAYWQNSACIDWKQIFNSELRYIVDLKVYCSDYSVGTARNNKNEFTNEKIIDTYRDITLAVNKNLSIDEGCRSLAIEIEGIDVKSIDQINMIIKLSESI